VPDGVDATEHVHGLDPGLDHNTPLQGEEPALLPSWSGRCPHSPGALGAMVGGQLGQVWRREGE